MDSQLTEAEYTTVKTQLEKIPVPRAMFCAVFSCIADAYSAYYTLLYFPSRSVLLSALSSSSSSSSFIFSAVEVKQSFLAMKKFLLQDL